MTKRYPQGILISCEVPWDDQEQFLEDAFRAEVRAMIDAGFHNVYIFGTAGEGHAVDTARFQSVAEVFREETARPGVLAQVGVIALSTAQFRERIGIAHRLGFRDFQISLPSWGALNDAELMRFFVDVCGAFPDSRFLHYNLARTKRVLTGRDYRRLVDAVPNLCATKNTGTNVRTTAELVRGTPELQHFLGESMFAAGCHYGECSMLSSFGPMMRAETFALFEAGRTRDPAALRMQTEYLDKAESIIAPLRRRELIDGAYDKVIMRLGGAPMPLRLLSPYECFTEAEFAECKSIWDRVVGSVR